MEVSKGLVLDDLPAVQIIPPIMQLYPDVEVQHADDTNCLGGKWMWVFSGRTVYLIAPSDGGEVRIMHSKDIAPLLHKYLKETGH